MMHPKPRTRYSARCLGSDEREHIALRSTSRSVARGECSWLSRLAALAGGIAPRPGPVALRNFSIDGNIHVTTSQFGTNLFIGNSATANGARAPPPLTRQRPSSQRADAVELAQSAVGRQLSSSEVSAYWSRAVAGQSRTRVGQEVHSDVERRRHSWDTGGYLQRRRLLVAAQEHGSFLHSASWHQLVWLGCGLRGTRWRELWISMRCAVYSLSIVLFYVFARYRFPLVPSLAILLAYALTQRVVVVAAPRIHGSPDAGAIVVAAAVLCNWPLQLVAEMRSIALFNTRGAAKDHQPEGAIELYRRAVTFPTNVRARSTWGGRIDGAGTSPTKRWGSCWNSCVAPDMASARTNLGISTCHARRSRRSNWWSLRSTRDRSSNYTRRALGSQAISARRSCIACSPRSKARGRAKQSWCSPRNGGRVSRGRRALFDCQ